MKLTLKERKLVKEYIQKLNESDISFTTKELSQILGLVWDALEKNNGGSKAQVLKSIQNKIEPLLYSTKK